MICHYSKYYFSYYRHPWAKFLVVESWLLNVFGSFMIPFLFHYFDHGISEGNRSGRGVVMRHEDNTDAGSTWIWRQKELKVMALPRFLSGNPISLPDVWYMHRKIILLASKYVLVKSSSLLRRKISSKTWDKYEIDKNKILFRALIWTLYILFNRNESACIRKASLQRIFCKKN